MYSYSQLTRRGTRFGILFGLLAAAAWAQPAALVKNINTNTNDSGANGFTATASGAIVFQANDGIHGTELWKTDGTAAGTALLADICPNDCDGNPNGFTALNGIVYFNAYDGNAWTLWRTDGTAANTYAVKSVNSGGPWYPNNFYVSGGTLYFNGYDSTHGYELWRSDGTANGTYMVADVNPGQADSVPYWFTEQNGALLFAAYPDSNYNRGLFRSDGTSNGTTLVKQVSGCSYYYCSLNPEDLTNVAGTVYFRGNDPNAGNELWKTDGTTQGTVLASDIYAGANSSLPQQLTNVNGVLYFTAYNGSGWGLWKNDGTGSVQVTGDIYYPQAITSYNGLAIFMGEDPSRGFRLWRSDGTSGGTFALTAGTWSWSWSGSYAALNNKLYFSGYDDAHGAELWTTDATVAGTQLVQDIWSGQGWSYPWSLAAINGTLYFDANDLTHGAELWKYDGTSAAMVTDINQTLHNADPGLLTDANGTLYFFANDGIHGSELWKSDGTANGTSMVADINPGLGNSNPSYYWWLWSGGDAGNHPSIANVGGTVYFFAYTPDVGCALWKTDGTQAGTSLVKSLSWYADTLIAANGLVYFNAYDPNSGVWTLWKSDGTSGGTVPVSPGLQTDGYSDLIPMNAIYFRAHTDANGWELWKTDGTAAGTTMVKDIATGTYDVCTSSTWNGSTYTCNSYTTYPNDSSPSSFAVLGSNLYFSAWDPTHGRELWKSDGTGAGTVLVADINPNGDSNPQNLTLFNGGLYFNASDGNSGYELWATTASGTSMVKDINQGPQDSYPRQFKVAGNLLYFLAGDTGNWWSPQLWKTDGTKQGTSALTSSLSFAEWNNFWQGNVDPSPFGAFNGTLYFRAYDDAHGYELWKSDGTTAGTTLYQDINPGAGSSYPNQFTVSGNTLFFGATDRYNGSELWALGQRYTVTATAGAGGTVQVSPASSDSTYQSGSTVQITAVPDSTHYFLNFTVGSQTVTTNPLVLNVTGPATVKANFGVSTAVSVQTSVTGRGFTVDGTAYSANQTFYWAPGSSHVLGAATQADGSPTRYLFTGWAGSNGSTSTLNSYTVSAPSSAVTYTANFVTQYQLTTASIPATGGSISGAGYYNASATANVSATAKAGYAFKSWTGATPGSPVTSASVSMTGPMTVTANFVVPTVTTVAAVSGQYSDPVTLSATVNPIAIDNLATGGAVQFSVNGQQVGTAQQIDSSGKATLSYTIPLATGPYKVDAQFTPANVYFVGSMGTKAAGLTVTAEDAVVTPSSNNPLAVKVAAPGGNSPQFTIAATIKEAADGSLGDIGKATASFTLSPLVNAGGGSPVAPASCVTPATASGVLTVSCTFNNVPVNVYDVAIVVGGNYYTGRSDSALAVYDPSLGFVTGGGTVLHNGVVGNFAMNVKYLKNGQIQGGVLYIEHRSTGDMIVKTNSLTSLSIVTNTAVVLSKATVAGVGNNSIQATAIDNGEPGTADKFGLQVTDGSGKPVADLTFDALTLTGGNIQVPQGTK